VVDFNGDPEGERVGNAGRNIMRADPIYERRYRNNKEHPSSGKCAGAVLDRSFQRIEFEKLWYPVGRG
jgi:hypothetical protein